MNKRTVIQMVIGILLFIGVSFIIRNRRQNSQIVSHSKEIIDTNKVILMIADSINKTCPKPIDSITKLLSASSDNKQLIFIFSLDIDSSIIKRKDYNELKDSAKELTLNAFKSQPNIQIFRDLGISLKMKYRMINGNFLFDFNFPPNTY